MISSVGELSASHTPVVSPHAIIVDMNARNVMRRRVVTFAWYSNDLFTTHSAIMISSSAVSELMISCWSCIFILLS